MNAEMAIPLEMIDIFWRTLTVLWPSISTPTPKDGPSCETGTKIQECFLVQFCRLTRKYVKECEKDIRSRICFNS